MRIAIITLDPAHVPARSLRERPRTGSGLSVPTPFFMIEPNIVALLRARSPSTLIERASVHPLARPSLD
jgi:hypothetical protein